MIVIHQKNDFICEEESCPYDCSFFRKKYSLKGVDDYYKFNIKTKSVHVNHPVH